MGLSSLNLTISKKVKLKNIVARNGLVRFKTLQTERVLP